MWEVTSTSIHTVMGTIIRMLMNMTTEMGISIIKGMGTNTAMSMVIIVNMGMNTASTANTDIMDMVRGTAIITMNKKVFMTGCGMW
jgi:hypothetical protein